MKINKKYIAAGLIIVMIVFASMIQKREILTLDEDAEKIIISSGDKEVEISEKNKVKNIIDRIVEDSKKLKKDSVSDSPNDAQEIYTLNIISKKEDRLYIYKNKKKYFIERPYEGIYSTNKKVFDMIGEQVKEK